MQQINDGNAGGIALEHGFDLTHIGAELAKIGEEYNHGEEYAVSRSGPASGAKRVESGQAPTAAISVRLSSQMTRLRPSFLAMYSAWSARSINAVMSSPA